MKNEHILLFISLFMMSVITEVYGEKNEFDDINIESINRDDLNALTNFVSHLKRHQSPMSQSFVTVGGEKACDFQSIQQAVDSNAPEIRVANTGSPYKENVVIHARSVFLHGGFSNCGMAFGGLKDDFNAVLDGGKNGKSTMFFSGLGNESDSHDIQIKNIDVINGVTEFKGGGVFIDSSANVFVSLENMDIKGNFSQLDGGGIHIEGNLKQKLYLRNVDIVGNTSMNNGGGLSCRGDGSILMDNDNSFLDNTAFKRGGGLSLDKCRLSAFPSLLLSNNISYSDGGAIVAVNHSTVNFYGFQACLMGHCLGSDGDPINIWGNSAVWLGDDYDTYGGAVYLSKHAKADFQNVAVSYNNADKGGAVAADYSSIFKTSGVYPSNCWGNDYCNWYSHNYADEGGVFYIGYLSELNVQNSVIFHNNANIGIVARVRGSLVSKPTNVSVATFEGVLMSRNGEFDVEEKSWKRNDLINLTDNTKFQMLYSTVADNILTGSVFSDSGYEFALSASIIDENVDIYSGKDTASFHCLLVHEKKSLQHATAVHAGHADFINPEGYDYHLAKDSLGIDFCDADLFSSELKDIDGHSRGLNIINVPNHSGVFDVGYDERAPWYVPK